MVTVIFLFEAANKNSLSGFVPEQIGLLIFGAVLIAFAAGLRRVFSQTGKNNLESQTAKANRKIVI